jgi:molecular chaperone IbpA
MEDMEMRNYDLTPLLRATVGFDRMFNMLDTATRLDQGAPSYPPYNIEKIGEDSYHIVMAVAGFAEADLEVTAKENSLVIIGRKDKAPGSQIQTQTQASATERYLHRGIATRAFERRFDLADHIRVTGARLENGLQAAQHRDRKHRAPTGQGHRGQGRLRPRLDTT